eukprot:CAMPEP_0168732250 /NCGR_PEP_ID=MMETSP0724-20121128/7677_1 /TAXON_ID=265536 /ORGANISM="Amphiprora sp., Strain CCMP467" /LENGTH=584 /DNA_ID=CAMNT_0008779269 /DNA_START=374 /DNA_END=2128 /DNA_ORIENTATION=-
MTTATKEQPQQQQQQQQPPPEVAVCCGCRPQRQTSRRKQKKASRLDAFRTDHVQRAMVAPAPVPTTKDEVADNDDAASVASSLFYFDAVEEPLGEEEYPPIFTTAIVHPKPQVTLDDPKTLLRKPSIIKPTTTSTQENQEPNKSGRSVRFVTIAERPASEHAELLKSPRVPQAEKGFPGGLTVVELEECQKFLRGLKALEPGVLDQVYSFRDVEEEPYTICRWLRATKFVAQDILDRLADNQPMFERAQQHDFYPDPSSAIGAPVSVFLSQYPFLPIGTAKNGCPVNYFMAGQINPEGILSVTTAPKLEGFFWWSFMHKMKSEMKAAVKKDPDFVRMEGINILDLKGLSSSAINSDTMSVVKLSSKIADFFPETLHCMLILNAPAFFSFSWGLIKKLIDPRTAARIQVFSNEEKGRQALRGLIGTDEIPRDYGGGNISIAQAFAQQAADPSLIRQETELVHVKKGRTTKSHDSWKLRAEETMTISSYTRSCSAAAVTVLVNGKAVQSPVQVACSISKDENDPSSQSPQPQPNQVCLAQKVKGPGTVTVEVKDLDNAPREFSSSSHSRGYFLIVGNVKKETMAEV